MATVALLDQRVTGQAEDALADLVPLDLGRAAGDGHGPVHEHEHVRHAARPVHEDGVGAVELGEDRRRVVAELGQHDGQVPRRQGQRPAVDDAAELGQERVNRTTDVVNVGDTVKVKVLGFDGNQDAVNAVKKGDMVATVLQPIVEGTEKAMTQLDGVIKNGKTGVSEEKQAIDCVLVTKANADQLNNFVLK